MKSKMRKFMAVFMAITMLSEIIFPTAAFALTGGPSQPEVQSFEPIGTSEMVDVFSGDFVYNIPLMDVGGYPVNISYHSGVGMDQEASWVGLGWNINMGAITRNMRGLPDDFNGDNIVKELNIKPNRTFGLSTGFQVELFGIKLPKIISKAGLEYSFGIYHNNYKGIGYEANAGLTFATKNKSTLELGLGLNSQTGIGFSANLNFEKTTVDKDRAEERISGIGFGSGYNSRAGLKDLTIGLSSKKSSLTFIQKDGKNTDEIATKNQFYGANGSSSISFGTPTYSPAFSMPMVNYNLSFRVTIGGELFGSHPNIPLNGYFTEQRLYKKIDDPSSYGYLYSDRGANDEKALHDFNREKDGQFTEESPNLPLTNYTYDVYSVAGQGTGGMYRPFRGDIGVVYDKATWNINLPSGFGGVELGIGALAHNGADIKPAFSFSRSGRWNNHNKVKNDLNFVNPNTVTDPLYESVSFKQAGEKITVGDQSFLDRIGGTQPVRIALDKKLVDVFAVKKFETKNGGTIAIGSEIRKLVRDKRNQAISFLTKREAGEAGLDKDLYSGISSSAQPHHTAEISVLNPDGRRYVYGLPAYNNLQHEVTFNVLGKDSSSCSDGLVKYAGGTDNSLGNNQGIDNYFSRTKLPGYAHSYLLTGVLSTDYVDVSGNGISDDDLGSAVKINYVKKSSAYKWRTPYEGDCSNASQSKANYQEGFKSKATDDKASYVYGEKELFYVSTVETKTHVAVFTVSKRDDGLAVEGENGGKPCDVNLDNNNSFKLDSIALYSKPDYISNGVNAVPIKVVHFVYNYSLCPGISNSKNNGGKLTLKNIFFTYGRSKKGKLSPYEFAYKQGVENPSYNIRGYDRWGNFKPNPLGTTCNALTDPLTNIDFPYVDQDKTLADQYASVWSLEEILLPSGGKIEVDYESDDYAYVQDRRAMQMFKILGAGTNSDYQNNNRLFTKVGALKDDNYLENLYFYFDLQKDPNDPLGNTYLTDFKNDYFAGITDMYYNCLVDLTNNGKYEYVSGYAEIENFGRATNDLTKGWVKLKRRALKDDDDGSQEVHPISKAAWQFTRINLPEYVYPGSNPNGTDESIIRSLAGFWTDLQSLFTGFNRTLRRQEFGSTFVPGKSWVRLLNPSKKKLGGGVRVSEVRINDQWDKMTAAESPFSYGQHYDYTLEENGRLISSGVASYEPGIGGEENPFRQLATAFVDKHKLAPNDFNYTEDPFGESFFPSASVGYSRVTVKNLERPGVKRNATGFVVHEFYTAKDFPTIADNTPINKIRKKPGFLAKFLNIRVRDLMTASQGYTIELNDMHGKAKAQWVYAEDKPLTPISGVQYFYKTDPNNSKHLNNNCTVIRSDGAVAASEIGVEIDAITDMRQANTESFQAGVEGNLDAFIAAIFPAAVPNILPAFSSEKTRFRSAVVTKVINRSGILEKTVAHDLGSSVSTSNLAYDAETGEVLLTRTQNDFEDPVFSFTYPAHWAYEGMGSAYKKTGTYFKNVSISPTGVLSSGAVNVDAYLVPGDEIIFEAVNGFGYVMAVHDEKAWIYKANGQFFLIKQDGYLFDNNSLPSVAPFTWYAKVIRSGMRNQQITPIGTFTSLSNPLDRDNNGVFDNINHSYNILNASTVEFSDQWKMFCCHPVPSVDPVCEPLPGAGLLLNFFNDPFVKTNYLGCSGVTPAEGCFYVTGATTSGCESTTGQPTNNSMVGSSSQGNNTCTQAQVDQYTSPDPPLSDPPIEVPCKATTTLSGFAGIPNAANEEICDPKAAICLKTDVGSDAGSLQYAQPWCTLRGLSLCDGLRNVTGVGTASSSSNCDQPCVLDDPFGGEEGEGNTFELDCGLKLSITYEVTFWDGETCNFSLDYEDDDTAFFFQDVNHFENLIPDPDFIVNGTTSHFLITAVMNNGQTRQLKGSSDCVPMFVCNDDNGANTLLTCCKKPGDVINPYIEGLSGNWRAKKSWLYLTDRGQTRTNDNTNIRKDGTFVRFNPFWNVPSNPVAYWNKDETNWTFTSEVTEFSPFGFEVENRDALGRHSAALYGYANTLPVAVASNSRFKDIAFDGMEDYNLPGQCATHFSFFTFKDKRTPAESHTGKYAMGLEPDQEMILKRALTPANIGDQPVIVPYQVREEDCIGQFSPKLNYDKNQRYVLSLWVKQEQGMNSIPVYDYSMIEAKVSLNNTPLALSPLKRGLIIDGWQRLEMEFTVPVGATGSISVGVKNNSNALDAYFDDIRIHPFNGNMKSFVYDPVNLRLMAELDENNYATFYEYDEEGALIRVKKETERGIMTIQESRNNTQKGVN